MNTPHPHVLIVEDDSAIRDLVTEFLTQHQYTISTAPDGKTATALLEKNHYDLILLDLNLPHKDGHTICREIRATNNTTPIIITSVRNAVTDKVDLLDSGADDYLTKPYAPEELLARVQALLRRSGKSNTTQHLEHNGLVLDIGQQAIRYNNQAAFLTVTEFTILEHLLTHKEQIINRQSLMEVIWPSTKTSAHVLDTHMVNLRNKIKKLGVDNFIKTIPNLGYRVCSV